MWGTGWSVAWSLQASRASAGFNLSCSAFHALKRLSHDRLGTWSSVPLAPLLRDEWWEMQPSVLASDLVLLLHWGCSCLQPRGLAFHSQLHTRSAPMWSTNSGLLCRGASLHLWVGGRNLGARDYAYECDDSLHVVGVHLSIWVSVDCVSASLSLCDSWRGVLVCTCVSCGSPSGFQGQWLLLVSSP